MRSVIPTVPLPVGFPPVVELFSGARGTPDNFSVGSPERMQSSPVSKIVSAVTPF
jgi:hypothetical protein